MIGGRRWLYIVRDYYADDVNPPKRPGDLALEAGNDSLSGAQLEEQAFRERPDIGQVDLIGPNR